MDKDKMRHLINIVYQYGNLIFVSDLNIKVQGRVLSHIFYREEYDILQFFAGNLVNDIAVFPTEEELDEIFVKITDNY